MCEQVRAPETRSSLCGKLYPCRPHPAQRIRKRDLKLYPHIPPDYDHDGSFLSGNIVYLIRNNLLDLWNIYEPLAYYIL